MYVHELRAENFKRLKLVQVTFPKNGTVEIFGKNAAGKSSLLDALFAALGGAKAHPVDPIRHGQRRASVEVNLGDIVVRKEWTQSSVELFVTDAGVPVKRSPQGVLDALFSRLAFDPMQFCRMAPKDQAETLRRITGLDLTALDRKRAALYQERTEVNRAVKDSESLVRELPHVEPCEEVSVAELNAELKAAIAHNKGVADQCRKVQRLADEVTAVERLIIDLEAKLKVARERLFTAEAERNEAELAVQDDRDLSEITSKIAEADQTNRRARQYRERQAASERWHANQRHAQTLTEQIEDIDQEKQQRLAAVTMPVPGLGLDGDLVTMHGIPFVQVSTSEQIRASLAISASDNPELRVIRIKEGSLLDDDSIGLVAEWAERNDMQVLIERVADKAVRSGVCIQEGEVWTDPDRLPSSISVGKDWKPIDLDDPENVF